MNVLTLVTAADSPSVRQQLAVLSRQGASCTTVPVPSGHEGGVDGVLQSVLDYARFYPRVVRESLDEHDLVHANSGLAGPAAVAQPSRPVVLSLVGAELRDRFAPVSTACARLSDAVIVTSREMARLYGEDCWIVPRGVDLERFAPCEADRARPDLGWSPDAHHVLAPGDPESEGEPHRRVERIVDELDGRLDDAVHLPTAADVPHERLPACLNAADAVLVTHETERSAILAKEALACDVPVVATPVGSVRRHLADAPASTVGETEATLVDGLEAAVAGDVAPAGRSVVRDAGLWRTGERLRAIYAHALAATGRASTMSADIVSLARYESRADAVVDTSLPVPAPSR